MRISELRAQRHAKLTELQGVVAVAEKAARDLDEGEEKRFGELRTEVEGIDKQIERREALDEMERRSSAAPAEGAGDTNFEAECRSFSLLRAIASQVPGSNVDAGREKEV